MLLLESRECFVASWVVHSRQRRRRRYLAVCMINRYSDELNLAVAVIQSACRICYKVQNENLSQDQTEKVDSTPVTSADLAIQALISSELAHAFPQDGFVGEEDCSALTTQSSLGRRVAQIIAEQPINCAAGRAMSQAELIAAVNRGNNRHPLQERYWVLDPIDGTRGFLARQGYVIGLALVLNGNNQCVLSVMGCPQIGKILVAVKDQGFAALSVEADPSTAAEALQRPALSSPSISTPLSSWTFSGPHATHVPLLMGSCKPPQRLCCGSLVKYASVALGEVSAFVQLGAPCSSNPDGPGLLKGRGTRVAMQQMKSWDHVAGWLVVTESGGRLFDGNGNPPQLNDENPEIALVEHGLVATSSGVSIEGIQQLIQTTSLDAAAT